MAEEQRSVVSGWLMRLDPPTRSQVVEVSERISELDPRLNQAIKWGRLTFALEENWHHWLCGIAVTKKTRSLVFHKGVLLADPGQLLTGTGRYVRQLPLTTAREHPDAVGQLVRSAIDHETDSLE